MLYIVSNTGLPSRHRKPVKPGSHGQGYVLPGFPQVTSKQTHTRTHMLKFSNMNCHCIISTIS